MTADELHEAVAKEEAEGYGEILQLAGKLSEECQLYLLVEVMRLRSHLRGEGLGMRLKGEELIEKAQAGPWWSCTECGARWLDPHNPPPETEDTCGHSVPT